MAMENNDDAKNKKEYELAVLVANEGDLAAMSALLKEHNAEMTSEPRAKNLTLAYEIEGHKEAVFAYCLFKAFPADAKNLEQSLVSNLSIIRSLMIASPPVAQKFNSAMPMRAGVGAERKPRTVRTGTASSEARPAAVGPLSNEALEKKIEEISQ